MNFKEFREHVKEDLVGVPPVAAFDGLPPEEHPFSLFPDARTVVVVGRRLARGAFRPMEEGSLWVTPGRWLTQFDDLVRWIERQGWECVPYNPSDVIENIPGHPVRAGACAPQGIRLSLEHAAVAAGLGEIGYHGMFMSRAYGIRQALGLLVTDMPVEPGPGDDGQGPVCDRCMACVKACPLGAISATDASTLACAGRSVDIGAINGQACRACPNGTAGDSRFFAGADELHFEIRNNRIVGDRQSVFARGSLPNRLAAACGRACIAHYEAAHDTGGYRIPFRIREPWGFRPDEHKEW